MPVPDEGYVYQTGWRLATSDIDEHRRLRLDGVARYIQEVGAEHLADAELAEVHPHWIVLRTVIDVIEPIEIPSDITFRRWCAGLSSRWCNMRVQLEGAEGGRIETEGFWICMNKDTLTPSRLTDYCVERFGSTTEDHRLKWRPWVTEQIESGPNTSVTPFPLAPHRYRPLRTRQQHHLLAWCAGDTGPGARTGEQPLPRGARIPQPHQVRRAVEHSLGESRRLPFSCISLSTTMFARRLWSAESSLVQAIAPAPRCGYLPPPASGHRVWPAARQTAPRCRRRRFLQGAQHVWSPVWGRCRRLSPAARPGRPGPAWRRRRC